MKKYLLLAFASLLFQAPILSQRNMDDLFFTQNSHYYNAAYAPTNRDTTEFSTAYDTHTMLKIAPNNTGKNVMPSLSYQAFSKIDNFTFVYNFNHQYQSFSSRNELGIGAIYSLNFKPEHKLSFGLKGGFSFYNLKRFNAMEDVQIPEQKKMKLLADVDFGIHYFIKKFELGVSGKHLLASKYAPDDILFQNQRGFYTQISYNFTIGKNVELKPSLFLTPLNYSNAFIALEVGLFKKVYTQYAFRLNELRHQYNVEYRFQTPRNSFFAGLAFNHSIIYTDFNVGIRLGYYIRD